MVSCHAYGTDSDSRRKFRSDVVYILDPAVDFYRLKSIHGPKISEYFIYRADFTDLHSSQYCSFNNSDSLLCDISYDGIKSE